MQEDEVKIQQRKQNKKKNTGFAQYSFIYELYKAILVNGIKVPTPVQRKAIPIISQGKDAILCYKTGSGKTLAYLLPMINKLKCHSKINGARALIIIPTKDLAEQITKVMKTYIKFTDLRYTLVLGGHTFQGQFESLSSNPDIIIATPGRLMQLLMQAQQKMLGRIQMIIFDQADNLFEAGFLNQIKEIVSRCPNSQKVMVSATINDKLNQFAGSCLRQYSYIHQEISLPETMKIDFFILRSEQKVALLLYFLQKIMKEKNKAIVFCSTRYHVDYLLGIISKFYQQTYGVYGKMDVEQRADSIQCFRKDKSGSILVVTDVAARGLDIPSVKYVIHFDYPTNHKIFVHRSGRTARKGQSGTTLAFVTHLQLPYLTELSTYVGRRLENQKEHKGDFYDNIGYGQIPSPILSEYINAVRQQQSRDQQLKKMGQLAEKAFEKFKKCRAQTSQTSLKKARNLQINVHPQFSCHMQNEQEQFLKKLHNYTPKKSFLELQRINLDKQPQNDQFLTAVQKIRKDQRSRKEQVQKKQMLRQKNSKKWKDILSKQELKDLQNYKQTVNSKHLSINNITGVQVQFIQNTKPKKSQMKDFKNPSQYISDIKLPGHRSEFDNLPRIRNNQIDEMIRDENPTKKKNKRIWDQAKRNYVWKKDEQDKLSKDQKGKKAYEKWKKQSKLIIPKAGQMEDEEKTQMAQQRWNRRRKFRHGWKQNVDKSEKLKNNKTKALLTKKKLKTKLIKKASKPKTMKK